MIGAKGGIGICFKLLGKSFLFINCHLCGIFIYRLINITKKLINMKFREEIEILIELR